MCEFCTEHGEGKKWYLQMKNYSDILFHEELSASQKEMSGANTRVEFVDQFFKYSIMPAISNRAGAEPEIEKDDEKSSEQLVDQPSEEEILEKRKVVHFGQVLPIEDVEEVINIVDSITRLPCGCRYYSTGKADKRYCFGLGMDKWGVLGKYPDAASSLEVLDKKEAKKIFRDYDQEGLIHSIWTGVTPYVIGICNCDRDCLPYRGYIENRGSPAFFRAEYICQVDWDLCEGCKSCMSQCQFGAQYYSSTLGKVYINPAQCFGCGTCRAACVNGAIKLIPRQESPEAVNVW